MKRRKNILAVLLAVTVMATAMPGSAIAAPVDGQTTEVSAKAGTEKAEKVFADNASTIADETLALEVTKAAPAGYTKEWKINGEAVTIGVEKR